MKLLLTTVAAIALVSLGGCNKGAARFPRRASLDSGARAPICASSALSRPLRLAVQDVALSRRKHGFESRRGHQANQRRKLLFPRKYQTSLGLSDRRGGI